MLIRNVDSLVQARPETLTYIRLLVRLLHLALVLAPGGVWLAQPGAPLHGLLAATLSFAGVLTLLAFQALGLYGSGLFGRQLQLRRQATAWSLTFIALMLVGGQLPLLAAASIEALLGWYASTLALLLLARLALHGWCRRLVRRGVGLLPTVILGCTASGNRLAAYLTENADVRARLVGYVDDRTDRQAFGMAGLPYLGDMPQLERMVRAGQAQLVLVALPWSAVERMGDLVSLLRRLPVTVLLAPDMAGLQHAHHRVTAVAGPPMFNISELPLRAGRRCSSAARTCCSPPARWRWPRR